MRSPVDPLPSEHVKLQCLPELEDYVDAASHAEPEGLIYCADWISKPGTWLDSHNLSGCAAYPYVDFNHITSVFL